MNSDKESGIFWCVSLQGASTEHNAELCSDTYATLVELITPNRMLF